MRGAYMVVFSFLLSTSLQAQYAGTNILSGPTTGKYRLPYQRELTLSSNTRTAPAQSTSGNAVQYNMYGDLRDDNPEYNQKSPLWLCGIRVVMTNVTTWASDRFVFNADYARIGPSSWKQNLTTGLVWDTDRFGMNYFFHPYSGAGYFNAARANGYNFCASVPFALGGSLMWEYFGENTLPSSNDLINTTVTGAFLGEISYRLSSNVLDDRTSGSERLFRELLAGFIDPPRFFSRFLQGKFVRATSEEIYQKEPLNLTFSAGARLVNDGRSFGTGSITEMVGLHLDYGNPFEQRSRKIFDYFKIRANLTFGAGRKLLDNVTGEGILFGKNIHSGNLEMLIGGFQHYDFWDNKTFELGTIAFGGGIISALPVSANSNLYCDVHLGIVPFAGNSTQVGPDTSQFIDYNYGGGAEGKLETTLNLGGWASVTFRGYYYWIRTFVGEPGDNFIGIIKPSVVFRLAGNFGLGFEQLVYFSDRYLRDYPDIHDVRTEEKIFLQFHLDNFKQEKR